MKYSGIDLHSNNCVVAVIDEQDRVVYRKRLANDLGLIAKALQPYRDELQGVVVESTFNWYWLVDGLIAAGFRLHLANTAAIKQYEGLKLGAISTCPASQGGIGSIVTPHKFLFLVQGRILPLDYGLSMGDPV